MNRRAEGDGDEIFNKILNVCRNISKAVLVLPLLEDSGLMHRTPDFGFDQFIECGKDKIELDRIRAGTEKRFEILYNSFFGQASVTEHGKFPADFELGYDILDIDLQFDNIVDGIVVSRMDLLFNKGRPWKPIDYRFQPFFRDTVPDDLES
jgi:hypothetical protein